MSHVNHDWPEVHGHCVPCLIEKLDAANQLNSVLLRVEEEAAAFHDVVRSECGEGDGDRYRAYGALQDALWAADLMTHDKRKCDGCENGWTLKSALRHLRLMKTGSK